MLRLQQRTSRHLIDGYSDVVHGADVLSERVAEPFADGVAVVHGVIPQGPDSTPRRAEYEDSLM